MPINLFSNRKHPYQEALHTLLYDFPEGLSEEEIVEQLSISKRSCRTLLRAEQIHDMISADPYSGILLYQSKQDSPPKRSLSQAIKIAEGNAHMNLISVLFCSFSLIGISLFSIKIYVVNELPETQIPQPLSLSKVTEIPGSVEWQQPKIDISHLEKSQLQAQKEEMERRIAEMRSQAKKNNCENLWQQNETCYIGGRLLSQEEFDREMEWMREQLANIQDRLNTLD